MASYCFPIHGFRFQLLLALLALSRYPSTEAQNIGACFGRTGDNLPTAKETVELYKSNRISKMRLYAPDRDVLQALQGSGITLILGVPNDHLQSLASNASAAAQWVTDNVVPFASTVKYIAVGDEVRPGDSNASFLLPAMENVLNSLASSGLSGLIKVSTSMGSETLSNTFPSSNSVFISSDYFTPIVAFLKSNGSPLLAAIFPYYALSQNGSISLPYALFTSLGTVFTDSGNGLAYQNLFDALVDSFYAAMEKVGGSGVGIVVSQSGWPSQGVPGNDVATIGNAGTYYKNLIGHVGNGTPKKPMQPLETYLFTVYDEDIKQGDETQRHFGVFTPAQGNKYRLTFTPSPALDKGKVGDRPGPPILWGLTLLIFLFQYI